MGIVISALLLVAGCFFLESFFVMLFWGAIASWFDAPTISYVQSWVVTVFLSILGLFNSTASKIA